MNMQSNYSKLLTYCTRHKIIIVEQTSQITDEIQNAPPVIYKT